MVDAVHFMRVMIYFLKKKNQNISMENEVWISLGSIIEERHLPPQKNNLMLSPPPQLYHANDLSMLQSLPPNCEKKHEIPLSLTFGCDFKVRIGFVLSYLD